MKFPSSKSNCIDLNKWHAIFVTWSNKAENLSNCWFNCEKVITFTTGNIRALITEILVKFLVGIKHISQVVLVKLLDFKGH